MDKRDVQLTPEWREADALAQAMYEQRFPGAPWRGRKINRAYWRRLAAGEIKRRRSKLEPSA